MLMDILPAIAKIVNDVAEARYCYCCYNSIVESQKQTNISQER